MHSSFPPAFTQSKTKKQRNARVQLLRRVRAGRREQLAEQLVVLLEQLCSFLGVFEGEETEGAFVFFNQRSLANVQQRCSRQQQQQHGKTKTVARARALLPASSHKPQPQAPADFLIYKTTNARLEPAWRQ
jgi:hypothetical protein